MQAGCRKRKRSRCFIPRNIYQEAKDGACCAEVDVSAALWTDVLKPAANLKVHQRKVHNRTLSRTGRSEARGAELLLLK